MGKRAGRGRPREIEDGLSFGMKYPADMLARLDRLAGKIGISRSQLIRNLLEIALDDAEVLESLGVFTLASWIRAMKESMRERRDEVLQTA